MKQFYLILLIFLSSFCANSQEYFPLIEDNKVWLIASYEGTTNCQYTSLGTMEFSGDTLINNILYKKTVGQGFISSSEFGFCPPYELSPALINNTHFYREDVENKRVYQYIAEQEQEILLYDFSLEVGDTIPNINFFAAPDYIVESIDESFVNGEMRRRFILSNGGEYIEGIGGTPGFRYTLEHGVGFGSYILCVTKDGEEIYGGCVYATSIDELDFSKSVKVSPNPAYDKITLEISDFNESYFQVQVYDVQGGIVLEKKRITANSVIDVSALSPGVYSICGRAGNGIFNKKIVVY